MKKQYMKPEFDVVLLKPFQLLAGSPGAGDQQDPGLSRDLFDFEDESELEQFLNL